MSAVSCWVCSTNGYACQATRTWLPVASGAAAVLRAAPLSASLAIGPATPVTGTLSETLALTAATSVTGTLSKTLAASAATSVTRTLSETLAASAAAAVAKALSVTRTLSFIVTDAIAISIDEGRTLFFLCFLRHSGHIGHQPDGKSKCQSEIQFLTHVATSVFCHALHARRRCSASWFLQLVFKLSPVKVQSPCQRKRPLLAG